MPIPTTTGTNKVHRKEAVQLSVLEVPMPATAAATAGAATLNQASGVITSEAITTAAAGFYTLTLTNSLIDVNTLVFASARLGTASGASTQGHPSVADIQEAAGSVVIAVKNVDAAAAFNGTIQVKYTVIRKAGAPL